MVAITSEPPVTVTAEPPARRRIDHIGVVPTASMLTGAFAAVELGYPRFESRHLPEAVAPNCLGREVDCGITVLLA